MSLLLFTPAAKHTFTTINEKKKRGIKIQDAHAREIQFIRSAKGHRCLRFASEFGDVPAELSSSPPPPPQGFPVGAGVPELRGRLRLLRAERQPLPELRRAPPPARAPVRRPVSASARRAGPAVPPLPAGLPGVQRTGPVHG